jgi:hypothetical protein
MFANWAGYADDASPSSSTVHQATANASLGHQSAQQPTQTQIRQVVDVKNSLRNQYVNQGVPSSHSVLQPNPQLLTHQLIYGNLPNQQQHQHQHQVYAHAPSSYQPSQTHSNAPILVNRKTSEYTAPGYSRPNQSHSNITQAYNELKTHYLELKDEYANYKSIQASHTEQMNLYVDKLISKSTQYSNEIDTLMKQIDKTQKAEQSIKAELKDLDKENKSLKGTNDILRTKVSTKDEQIEELNSLVQKFEAKNSELLEQLKEKDEKIDELQELIHRKSIQSVQSPSNNFSLNRDSPNYHSPTRRNLRNTRIRTSDEGTGRRSSAARLSNGSDSYASNTVTMSATDLNALLRISQLEGIIKEQQSKINYYEDRDQQNQGQTENQQKSVFDILKQQPQPAKNDDWLEPLQPVRP